MEGISLNEILDCVQGRLVNSDSVGTRQGSIVVERPSVLSKSTERDVAFFFSKEYQTELLTAKPGVLITADPFVVPLKNSGLPLWKNSAVVSCPDPYLAMALLSEKFVERAQLRTKQTTGIHPTAVVDPSAELGLGVQLGPHVVIEANVKVGARTKIHAHSFVGAGSKIGEDCILYPNVTLYAKTELGRSVYLHSGSVIGADGFGYAPKRAEIGNVDSPIVGHQKIHHVGGVKIGDHVEIGANSCIDRGTLGDTVIGNQVKIDNLVQIGHNAEIQEGTIICGCVGVAGGSKIGRFVYIAGHSGIARSKIGDGAKIGAHTLISKDVPAGKTVVGNPQRDSREHFKAHAALNRLIKRGPGEKSGDKNDN